jgi:hypothetical protein
VRANQSLSIEDARKVEAGELRFRIVNVWKSLISPVVDHLLMFADSTTFQKEDLVAVEQRYHHYVGKSYAVKYNQATEFSCWIASSTPLNHEGSSLPVILTPGLSVSGDLTTTLTVLPGFRERQI